MPQVTDRWSAAATYEEFMGRWSRELARDFVQWLRATRGGHWLELGCGTGALTRAVCTYADPASVIACDPAESFIAYARSHAQDHRVSYVLAGAHDFPTRRNGYDSVTSLLALNFFPDPAHALQRMLAAVAAHGTISACVWDYAGRMQFLRYFWNAAVELDASARPSDEGVRFPICEPEPLTVLFTGAGLVDVSCEAIEIETEFASFDDYWQPFLGGTGPAPSFVAGLHADQRAVLRRKLESTLPVDANGRIPLRARAWAIRGVKS
jgi:SAM-dependent methyltransferase